MRVRARALVWRVYAVKTDLAGVFVNVKLHISCTSGDSLVFGCK